MITSRYRSVRINEKGRKGVESTYKTGWFKTRESTVRDEQHFTNKADALKEARSNKQKLHKCGGGHTFCVETQENGLVTSRRCIYMWQEGPEGPYLAYSSRRVGCWHNEWK